jgi:hypothetical protein
MGTAPTPPTSGCKPWDDTSNSQARQRFIHSGRPHNLIKIWPHLWRIFGYPHSRTPPISGKPLNPLLHRVATMGPSSFGDYRLVSSEATADESSYVTSHLISFGRGTFVGTQRVMQDSHVVPCLTRCWQRSSPEGRDSTSSRHQAVPTGHHCMAVIGSWSFPGE